MPLLENLGPALRLLREKCRVSQAQLERDAGLGGSSVSRYERGTERPTLTTLDAILRGLQVGPRDLVLALDEVEGRGAQPLPGRPRADWVAMLSGRYVDEARLFGLAYGLLHGGDAQARADFVASFEAVAREAARRVVAEIDAPVALVAEETAPYGPGAKRPR